MHAPTRSSLLAGAALATALAGGLVGSSTVHAEPQGFVEVESGVGFFYGTFEDGPNVILLVGGTAEEFCLESPDPFGSAEPGSAPMRIFSRADGSTDLKVNDKDQPIHLYEGSDAPVWIAGVCADLFDGDPTTVVPDPIASGTADLKVRTSIVTDDLIEVFNSVNGELLGVDGTEYRVRASADLVVENGQPVGDPADFVTLDLTEIRRG